MLIRSYNAGSSVLPVAIFLLFCGAIVLLLYAFQHSLIYRARSYAATDLPAGVEEIRYHTTDGEQVAFLVPPRDPAPGPPERLWVAFGGNASLALDWMDFVSRYPDQRAAFLLVDYPGFGKCEGKASPRSIRESSEKLLEQYHARLTSRGAEGLPPLHLLGHSLGAAAALQIAARRDVSRLVLLAPFTTLRAMARKAVGDPLSRLLRHDYDNVARLKEIVASPSPPLVVIIHGRRDEVIPVEMGRRLATEFPSLIRYVELAGADHNSLLLLNEAEVTRAMTE
ncbi:MAG: alpha/beta hydrolase [Bacteroidota bacterium]